MPKNIGKERLQLKPVAHLSNTGSLICLFSCFTVKKKKDYNNNYINNYT